MATSIMDRVPVERLTADARTVQLSRVLLTVLGALGAAIGWTVGRTFVAIGWTAGRIWLTGAYFAEAVIYGFKAGAKLPMTPPEQPTSR
jgi:hypothetical protein